MKHRACRLGSGRRASAAWPALAALTLAVTPASSARTGALARELQEHHEAAWRSLPMDILHDVLGHVPLQPWLAWFDGSVDMRLMSFGGEGWQKLSLHTGMPWRTVPSRMTFLPSGDALVSADSGGKIVLWEAKSGRRLRTVRHLLFSEHAGGAWWNDDFCDMQLLPDGERVLTFAFGGVGRVIIWNITDGSILHRFPIGRLLGKIRVLLGGSQIALGGWDVFGPADRPVQPVTVWDVADGTLLRGLEPHDRVIRMESSPCGSRLAMLMSNGVVEVFNASGWQLVQALQGAPGGSDWRGELRESLAISVAGVRVAAGARTPSSGCRFVLWDGLTGAVVEDLEEYCCPWGHVRFAFVPFGGLLVLGLGSSDFVLDASSGERRRALAPAPAPMVPELGHARVAVSACGRLVAACSTRRFDAWLVMWDVLSGRIVLQVSESAAGRLEPCRIAIGPPRSMAELLTD